MGLVKYLKSIVSQHLATVNKLNSLKTCTIALWLYCFITLAKIELENIGLSVSKMLGVFVKKLTADGKYSFPDREDLLQPVQLQLSKKRKGFLDFLLHIWNLNQMLNMLKKRWAS